MTTKMENGGKNFTQDEYQKGAMNDTISGDALTPELLYKMNKKIAQLTKVIYSLNTRGEELESQLAASRENEEKIKILNGELQTRVSTFKSKIEMDMTKIRDLETQANQSQFWQMECENLKRRLESDVGSTEAKILLSRAREEIDQLRVREKGLQFDLDQAKHTISNLKSHHDFIMRERDAQEGMEREKIVLEWQTRAVDLENRYKTQVRRATGDIEVIAEECALLRRQSLQEDGARDQNFNEEERKELLTKLRQRSVEAGEQRAEIIELQRKLHQANEETRRLDERLESSTKVNCSRYEARIKDLSSKCELLQKIDNDRELEYSNTMRAKLLEVKKEHDLIDEGYRVELRNLKQQNDQLKTEVSALRQSVEKTGMDYMSRVQILEQELAEKVGELDLKSKNFKVRFNVLESKNKQLQQENTELKNDLVHEQERHRQYKMDHEATSADMKTDMEAHIHRLESTENELRETCKCLAEVNEQLNEETVVLKRKISEKDREIDNRIEQEKESIENRIRLKLDRNWMDRLKQKEEECEHQIRKVEEEWKKKELTAKENYEKVDVELEAAKRIQEESRKKIREMRTQELELGKKQNSLQNSIKDLKKEVEASDKRRNEMESQCRRQRTENEKLSEQMNHQNEEIDKLKREIDTSRKDAVRLARDLDESRKKNSANTELEMKLQEFRRQLREKESTTESMRVDLQYHKNEADLRKSKIQRLEEELKSTEKKCKELQKQNSNQTSDQSRKSADLEKQFKKAQEDLKKNEVVIADLRIAIQSIDDEREEEMKIVQDALDEAAEEREELIKTFQKQLEEANTKNIAREQQMLEDFEWKLREMEKDNKQKQSEIEEQSKARLDAVRSMVESELSESLLKVAEDKKSADEMLSEVAHLKSYQAEVVQLRGVTFEFQKALRASARETENMKIRHLLLEEEIKNLKRGAQNKQNSLTRKKQTDDEDVKKKIAKVKKDLNSEWERRLSEECSQVRSDLESSYERNKSLALEGLTDKYETEIENMKQTHATKENELNEEMTNLKSMMSVKDSNHEKEMDELRTTTDRDIWELRMKLQRLDDSSYNKEQNLIEKHKEEIESTCAKYEEKIRDLTSQLNEIDKLKEVISSLRQDHDEKMAHLARQHQEVVDTLREDLSLSQQKLQELAQVRPASQPASNAPKNEKVALIEKYKKELDCLQTTLLSRDENIKMLTAKVEQLKTTNQKLEHSLSSSSMSSQSSNGTEPSRSSSQNCPPESSDSQKGGSGILGKVFGTGWFGPAKTKDTSRRGSHPMSAKKMW